MRAISKTERENRGTVPENGCQRFPVNPRDDRSGETRVVVTLFISWCRCRLSTALASAANPGIVDVVKKRLNERNEALAGLAKAEADVAAEKDGRVQADHAWAKMKSDLHKEVRRMSRGTA